MSEPRPSRAEEQARRRVDAFRFGVYVLAILFSLAMVMLTPPLLEGRIALQVVISLPLLAGLYVVSRSLRFLVFGIATGVVSTVIGVASIARHDDALLVFDLALRVAFLAVTAGWIVREVLRQSRVSSDTILGGICVYLLLGFLFAFLDLMVAITAEGAFQTSAGPILVSPAGRHTLESLPDLLYFSFATLTTAAYGDITPLAPLARLIAVSESMIGQLFPAIFIARLVGLHVAQRHSQRHE